MLLRMLILLLAREEREDSGELGLAQDRIARTKSRNRRLFVGFAARGVLGLLIFWFFADFGPALL
jgi:hypothetical protein